MGFEPTRAEHIGLAVQRLNHSATPRHIRGDESFSQDQPCRSGLKASPLVGYYSSKVSFKRVVWGYRYNLNTRFEL